MGECNADALDPEIRSLVMGLRKAGFNTSMSCQGGAGHLFELPVIGIELPTFDDAVHQREKLVAWFGRRGWNGYDISVHHWYNGDGRLTNCYIRVELNGPVSQYKGVSYD